MRAWAIAWALTGATLAAWLALGPLEGVAHVQDELVYELQARILGEGRLWEEARLPRAAFVYPFVTNLAGRRYGIFPNGWPAVLALGVLAGLPWLVNPVLHGISVLVGTRVASRAGGPALASLAAPLLALQPAMVLQGASRLSHALCALLTITSVAVVQAGPTGRRAVALGALLGWLALTRPLDAAVVGGVVAGWIAFRGEARAWALAALPIALAAALLLVQNQLYEGHWGTFPQNAWFARGEPPFAGAAFRFAPGCNALGFGAGRGCQPTLGTLGHTPAKALVSVAINLASAGRLWFGGWPLAFLLLGAWRRETRGIAALALGTWAALALAYSLYWYHGVCLGPRFHHAAAPLVTIALAAGLTALIGRLRLPTAAGLFLLIPFGWQVGRALPELVGFWGVDGRLRALEARWEKGPALVLVAYGPDFRVPVDLPMTAGGQVAHYSADARRGMWIERRDGPIVYAEFQPALVEATRRRWPDLPVYLLVLASDPESDRILPLGTSSEPQVTDLPLPVDPVAIE